MCSPIESTVQPELLNLFINNLIKVYDELLNIKEGVDIAFGSGCPSTASCQNRKGTTDKILVLFL